MKNSLTIYVLYEEYSIHDPKFYTFLKIEDAILKIKELIYLKRYDELTEEKRFHYQEKNISEFLEKIVSGDFDGKEENQESLYGDRIVLTIDKSKVKF